MMLVEKVKTPAGYRWVTICPGGGGKGKGKGGGGYPGMRPHVTPDSASGGGGGGGGCGGNYIHILVPASPVSQGGMDSKAAGGIGYTGSGQPVLGSPGAPKPPGAAPTFLPSAPTALLPQVNLSPSQASGVGQAPKTKGKLTGLGVVEPTWPDPSPDDPGWSPPLAPGAGDRPYVAPAERSAIQIGPDVEPTPAPAKVKKVAKPKAPKAPKEPKAPKAPKEVEGPKKAPGGLKSHEELASVLDGFKKGAERRKNGIRDSKFDTIHSNYEMGRKLGRDIPEACDKALQAEYPMYEDLVNRWGGSSTGEICSYYGTASSLMNGGGLHPGWKHNVKGFQSVADDPGIAAMLKEQDPKADPADYVIVPSYNNAKLIAPKDGSGKQYFSTKNDTWNGPSYKMTPAGTVEGFLHDVRAMNYTGGTDAGRPQKVTLWRGTAHDVRNGPMSANAISSFSYGPKTARGFASQNGAAGMVIKVEADRRLLFVDHKASKTLHDGFPTEKEGIFCGDHGSFDAEVMTQAAASKKYPYEKEWEYEDLRSKLDAAKRILA